RRDPLWQLLVEAARTLYWFHPLVWLAAWRVHVKRERACDDLVLNRGVSAADYARHLLAVVAAATRARIQPAALGIAMASAPRLESRIQSLFAAPRDRRPVTRRVAITFLCGCAVLALPLAAMHARPPSAVAQLAANERTKPAPAIALADETSAAVDL